MQIKNEAKIEIIRGKKRASAASYNVRRKGEKKERKKEKEEKKSRLEESWHCFRRVGEQHLRRRELCTS